MTIPDRCVPGDIKYKDKFPLPQVKNLLLSKDDGTGFGTNFNESRASYRFDSDNPTYIKRITASVCKANGVANSRFVPLAHNHFSDMSFSGDDSTFADFEFMITSEDDAVKISDDWLPSTLLNGIFEEGYEMPCIFETKRGSNIVIRARPIFVPLSPPEPYQIEFQLHTIKYFSQPEKVQQALSK
jgi:hypothetical protein